ncbi:MAG: SIS domain-containing protein [Anaerolineae bacterium]|nr:SIS domain-containing protein [Anaerolineae bacterium]NUQ04203.1 SIS domain-containing protein [Anaerolineae bacterium]
MSTAAGVYSLAEITSQPEVWGKAVETFHKEANAFKSLVAGHRTSQVIFTGCGSTYYLAQAGAALFQQMLGTSARAYPASEIALFPELVFQPAAEPLLIAVSRSGETTETLAAVRAFRQHFRGPVVAITCYESSLTTAADFAFVIPEAQETSLAQTRSFASMLVVVEALIASLAGRGDLDILSRLGATAASLLERYQGLAQQLGEDQQIERFFFLGSGPLYGIACEAMLKMKEMSLSYSEAFHVLEFRHGPMSMVDQRALVVVLMSDEAHAQEASVVKDMRARGAQTLVIADQDYGLGLKAAPHFVHIDANLPRWARPVAYLPVLQLMAFHRALSNGQNPDLPANLEFVISLDASMM